MEIIELENKRMDPIPESTSGSVVSVPSGKHWPSTTVFVTQVIIVYVVILCALINLTFYPEARQELWITLLSSSIGYLLPSPTIKKPKIKQENVD